MTVQTIDRNHFVSIPVDVNSKFLAFFSNITLRIDAEHPVDVFVVNGDEFEAFTSGRQFNTFYSARGITQVSQNVFARVPSGQLAYVVIQNVGSQRSAIYYEVS